MVIVSLFCKFLCTDKDFKSLKLFYFFFSPFERTIGSEYLLIVDFA